MNVIPRICRYMTKKNLVAFPPDNFLGNTDWYFAKNSKSGGVPTELKNLTVSFQSGNIESIINLFKEHGNDLACVIMEPYRSTIYSTEFYQTLRRLCDKYGTLLIFDETITSYRFNFPLAQYTVNCAADFTIIGKAFANGYALSAVIENEDLFCKIDSATNKYDLFDFSTDHAGETVGLAAAIKTLEIYNRYDVVDYLSAIGSVMHDGLLKIINSYGLNNDIFLDGQPSFFYINFNNPVFRDKFIKFFFDHKILCGGIFAANYTLNEHHISRILDVFDDFCYYFCQTTSLDNPDNHSE